MAELLARLPLRGVAIGGGTLLAGTVTSMLVDDPLLPALVAAIVLAVLLSVDDRTRADEE
jgi:hypothetical protein